MSYDRYYRHRLSGRKWRVVKSDRIAVTLEPLDDDTERLKVTRGTLKAEFTRINRPAAQNQRRQRG